MSMSPTPGTTASRSSAVAASGYAAFPGARNGPPQSGAANRERATPCGCHQISPPGLRCRGQSLVRGQASARGPTTAPIPSVRLFRWLPLLPDRGIAIDSGQNHNRIEHGAENPQFVSSAGGDYRLPAGVDVHRNPRIWRGRSSSKLPRVDMGTYEHGSFPLKITQVLPTLTSNSRSGDTHTVQSCSERRLGRR
jgi:hypothetical protein